MIWISLTLFGLILYFIVRNNVSRATTAPVWLLWLVLMLPALVFGGWAVRYGEKAQPPPQLLIPCTVMSLFLYIYLVRRNLRPLPVTNPPDPSLETPEVVKPDTNLLTKGEESQLQNCFPWSIFYLQQVDHRPQGVICRGQLRSQPEKAYQTIQDNIKTQFGDRFLVVFQDGAMNKPFFVLVPNPQAQAQQKSKAPVPQVGLALGLLLATLLTTTLAGLALSDASMTRQVLNDQPHLLAKGLPYAIALMAILGLHELGHYFTARFYKIKASLPYFIPVPFILFPIGTLGAFIQMRSPIPNRKALFDVGIAGPLAGLVITIPILIWGLMQSTIVPLPDKLEGLPFDAMNPSSSILFSLLSKLTLGSELTLGQAIDLHPLAISGWIGLIVTALNLMPIGQLDGGHIVHAMFGQRNGAVIGQISRLLVLLLSIIQPLLVFWAIILLFMPTVDQPALNDVSELDNTRDLIGLSALGLLVLIILPLPHSLAHLLLTANPLP
ncbi:MAG: site-2 protease family protein [Acaryochloris sp. RU_4_1]|nr:site-2 protease family protein [Acaryochloris sp. SU_5_25]NJM66706.1 site-2 protease family protein [Acaryochloris sp. RU_4_1]NJN37835.1 site-2 protease family protein [Acaryochloridaceae cyanobacterium CSU_3_4]NJR55526.1 site-2 protease family protein [Acaryochloris sp. CRU_2_0]